MGIMNYFNEILSNKINSIKSVKEYELGEDVIELGPASLENMTIIRDLISTDLSKFHTSLAIKKDNKFEIYYFPTMVLHEDKVIIDAAYLTSIQAQKENESIDYLIKKIYSTTEEFLKKGYLIFPERQFFTFKKDTESIYLLRYKEHK